MFLSSANDLIRILFTVVKQVSADEKKAMMKRLVETYDIDEVKVFEPSLNDIFVEYADDSVKEDNKYETI